MSALPVCLMTASFLSQAASPVMIMHQVRQGESWGLVAAQHRLTERQLRLHYNQDRFMTPLKPGEWIWLPRLAMSGIGMSGIDIPSDSSEAQSVGANLPETKAKPGRALNSIASSSSSHQTSTPTASATHGLASPDHSQNLPRLGPPDPKQAPKAALLKLKLARAAEAAANHKLDSFLEQQSSNLADSSLSFGSAQISDLLWLSPEQWSWDYQLPLFDKELLFNSRMALPLTKQVQGEVGVDYRDQRLTYQAGLNLEQPLGAGIAAHLAPVMDYQTEWQHQRGGVLLYLSDADWTLGAGQYQPLSGWQQQAGVAERAAAGQVLFSEGRLGWVPGLSVSSQFYQWHGRRLDLYGGGDKYKAAMSRKWSLNYAPWQIFRLQSSLLSNSKDKFETRLRLGVELPLGVEPGLWWKSLLQQADYRHYQPLQHHQVLVLEQK